MEDRQPVSQAEVAAGLLLILLLASARILLLPAATTDGGDFAGRVWDAMRWLDAPHLITHGMWGPLHSYLIGFALRIWPDPVNGPLALHVALGIATPLMVYVFTRTAFAGPRASLLVALAYAVYPIAIRNGLQVRSEVPFVLLLLVAFTLLELARREDGSIGHAIGAGLALTFAAMLRYEAWMLIPFLALLLWPKRRLMIAFVACSLVHPLFWMVGNGLHSGDPLFSVNVATRWEQDAMGRSGLPLSARIVPALEYPMAVLRGMTILLGILAVVGAFLALLRRERCRIWLLPLAGLSLLLMWSIARGALVPKLNYTVTLGTMLLPFTAVLWRRLGVEGWPLGRALALGAAVVALMAFTTRWSWMHAIGLDRFTSTDPVPTIENQDLALTLPQVINRHMPADPALISDFYGWGARSHVALLTRLEPERILLIIGAPNREVDLEQLADFLERYPEGVLIALEGSRFSRALGIGPGRRAEIEAHTLLLERVHRVPWPPGDPTPHLDIYRYRLGDVGVPVPTAPESRRPAIP